MIFFADENISTNAVRLLEVFDRKNEIRALEDCFERGTPDTEWIAGVATWSPRPVIRGGDGRILKNKAELAALRDADLTFVLLASGWTTLSWNDLAWKIIKAWPSIVQNVEKAKRASLFKVSCNTLKVEQVPSAPGIGRK